jgi:demethylmenaquinone methyltransferase/2-methoxy-6-polyprenyl-1,4-benzoquinol methylase
MGFFNWSAPVFGRFADRWSPDNLEEIAGWLSPFVAPGGHLLDVGGGTGALARRLHERLDIAVTVLDPTPEMLGYIPADGPVRAVLGTAEEMPFAEDTFDALIVTDAFHHFRDQPAAVAEFCRVVKPGGGVIVVELDPSGWVMRMIVFGEKLLGEPGAFFKPGEMCEFMAAHGIEGECTPLKGVAYRFVGVVVKDRPVA